MGRKAILLAAGKGTRMKSDLPKVLYPIGGRPIIDYVLDGLAETQVDEIIVVVGYRADEVRAALSKRKNITFAEQTQQLGTGHAVICCRDCLAGSEGPVFVIAGDSPMMRSDSVSALFDEYEKRKKAGEMASAVLGTARKETPFGMGRILRDEVGNFIGIVEEKDATDQQRKITEINMSYYVFDTADLLGALDSLTTNNAQHEYYITDVPAIMLRQGKKVLALNVLKPEESLGVNTVADVAAVEAEMRRLGRIA